MIDQTKPTGSIKPQVLSSAPIPISTTLVDDPVALVDDPNVLVGSQTTQIPILLTATQDNSPKGFIIRRR